MLVYLVCLYPVFLCKLSGKLIIVNVQSTVPQIDLFLNKFVHVKRYMYMH